MWPAVSFLTLPGLAMSAHKVLVLRGETCYY
jgi:hypothetical protein